MAEGKFRMFGEFGTAFLADLVYGKTIGKGSDTGSVAVGSGLAKELRPRLFGLGRDDEAAFAQALAQLDAVGQAKVLTRMKSLGNPDAADTPEARSFRLSFVTLPDLASRVEVMKMIADMPDSKWHDFVDVTGFANSGDLLKSLREFYRRFEIELAVIMLIMGAAAVYVAGALVRGDENAARRLEAGAAGLEEVSAKVRRWEESQDTKLRQQKRGFWSWLWPW